MSKYKPSMKREFSAKITFRLNFSPSTSKVVNSSRAYSSKKKRMPPKKTRAWLPRHSCAASPEEKLKRGRKSLSKVTEQNKRVFAGTAELDIPNKKVKSTNTKKQQGTSRTQKEKTPSSKENQFKISTSLYNNKRAAPTKPVSYELSDEEDSMLNMMPSSSENDHFYHLPTEINSTVIDLDDNIIELPDVQEVKKPEEDLIMLPILPLPNSESKTSVNSIAQNSSNIENVDTIIDKFLESNDTSFNDSTNKSDTEFLANVDKLLSNSLEIVEPSHFSVQPINATSSASNEFSRGNILKKCNPKSNSLIEVIDLSSSLDYSLPIIDISESSKNSHEKVVTSEQSDSSMIRNLGDCPICLEPIGSQAVASTHCGHIFCDPCIRNCVKNTKKCPNCRKTLNLKQIHPLFI